MRYFLAAAFATAVLANAPVAGAQTKETNLPWCESVAGGELECVHKTQADCEFYAQPRGASCVSNPRTRS